MHRDVFLAPLFRVTQRGWLKIYRIIFSLRLSRHRFRFLLKPAVRPMP
ncbi:hypothetical protein KNP414_05728 [Paenibacillus mucilaginosus KNP414]|uniref:Uncharacterized protein n=1 Tax=Paenibacillus mucilaginosus (strain KNP414) TaxID=1036673 RepID=F8FMT1_PAEMK|nr:hypothetical protein KNP414_05728 [Paenibacillus mucilaginosus KNP414]